MENSPAYNNGWNAAVLGQDYEPPLPVGSASHRSYTDGWIDALHEVRAD